MPLAPGTRLGPYEIVAPIGAGGMGEVYRARDTRLGRDVALKILPEELAGVASRRARFEQEARAVAALNHPNIVAVYDVGNGYMVTELVDGKTLRGAKFGLRKTLDIAGQIASGLAAAHAAGIVHRDLKPDNVLVTRDGRAKILDFGLARIEPTATSDETVSIRTEPGVVMGTVGYMSPEQVRGVEADHRSDIFSFGVMLYELLSGKRPFQGDLAVDTMAAILKHDAPELPETVPASLRTIVAHCLEKEPENRFQSTKDLGFALAQSAGRAGSAPVLTVGRRSWWIAALIVAVGGISFALATWLAHAPAATRWSAVQLGGPEIAINPRLSPDGHLLAFQAMIDGTTQVAVMEPESGDWNLLTRRKDKGRVDFVSWSPDGGAIYFSRMTNVPNGVFSVPFLGGAEQLVLENAHNPAALPDGTLLVSRINQEGKLQLFRFWPETGKLQGLPAELTGFYSAIRTSGDGRHAFVFGTLHSQSGGTPRLIDVDLATASARPIAAEGLDTAGLAAFAVYPDGSAAVVAIPAKTLTRMVRIPLNGRGALQDLFTVTSDVRHLDVGADGSVLVNLRDRPFEVIRFRPHGGQPLRIASFSRRAGVSRWEPSGLVALPDGRAVTRVEVAGRSRLMAVEPGKAPARLINTTEETGTPMTAVSPNRIAFAIGPAPHETIAVADISNGRIVSRISPGKGAFLSLSASPDGGTLYFAAGGSVWLVGSGGGAARRICAGDFVEAKPSGGSLVVERSESSQIRLFEVPAAGGAERAIPIDPAFRVFNPSLSPGKIRADGQMLVVLTMDDSWFAPVGQLDLQSGRITRIAGDGASDLDSPAWTHDGQILANRMLLRATIWMFMPERN